MEPVIKKLPEFCVVGVTTFGDCSSVFAKAWDMFLKLKENVEWKDDDKGFGLEFYTEEFHKENKWFYMACKEVNDFSSIPVNMVAKRIPQHQYAVFSCKGGISQIGKTFQFGYREWIPKSDYVVADCFDFELYDERFKGADDPESVIDIYIPVKKK